MKRDTYGTHCVHIFSEVLGELLRLQQLVNLGVQVTLRDARLLADDLLEATTTQRGASLRAVGHNQARLAVVLGEWVRHVSGDGGPAT